MGTKKITILLDTYATLKADLAQVLETCTAQETELLAAMPEALRTAWERVQWSRATQREALEAQLDHVTAQIKSHVGALGETVVHGGYQAVYSRGQVRWNDDFLQGVAVTHPEILQGRREGQPSVRLLPAKPTA